MGKGIIAQIESGQPMHVMSDEESEEYRKMFGMTKEEWTANPRLEFISESAVREFDEAIKAEFDARQKD